MNNQIIVLTDFSDSSANALKYACGFAREYGYNIGLTHVYHLPGTYTADGGSMAALNDAIEAVKAKMLEVLETAKAGFPEIKVQPNLMTGDFLESLKELIKETNPALVMVGAAGEYSRLWLWGEDWLNAVVDVQCPVLVIPPHSQYTTVLNVAFACDYKNLYPPHQVQAVKDFVTATEAGFYVVSVTSEDRNSCKNVNVETFDEAFFDLDPQYMVVENASVILGLADFVKQYYIDLLIVIPQKHGLWFNLVRKSYTKQLALLNHLPVMAIH